MGPGLFSPEDTGTRTGRLSFPRLQWGRACSARRTYIPGNVWAAGTRASMGPGLFSPEDSLTFMQRLQHLESFNGAGLVQPGGLLVNQSGPKPTRSFNGAGLVQPGGHP